MLLICFNCGFAFYPSGIVFLFSQDYLIFRFCEPILISFHWYFFVVRTRCFASVYHINMVLLFTIPTQNSISHYIFSQIGPLRRIDCLAPIKEYRRKVSFLPKDTSIHCPVLEPNRESTILRLPACTLNQ